MGSIIKRTRGNSTHYIYQESYRVKVNNADSGKTRGTGRSKVCTRAIYLGTAEHILGILNKSKQPANLTTRRFGLVAAAYQCAKATGMLDILMKHLPGERGGIPLWLYFFVTIVNRLDNATSKNRMSRWLQKTILPELLNFDAAKMTGKNFWLAADDVVSERDLRGRRNAESLSDDPFGGLSEDVFVRMEADLFARIDALMGLAPETICYDTTNFYTYVDEPKRSELANTCHSKDSKHHLRHVGLLMAVERSHGIPLMSRVYRANSHDSKVFSAILADLVLTIKRLCGDGSELVIVLDKGNNSQKNFETMSGEISWVGALVPSHHQDLIDLKISDYHGVWKGRPYYRSQKTLMGMQCAIVLTYNSATATKQEHTLRRGIGKLKQEIENKWANYKRTPKQITPGIITMLKNSRYGDYLKVSVRQGAIHVEENQEQIEIRQKRFGKNLIFSNMLCAETGYLIDTYNQKQVIENDFHILKDPHIIRFRPIRHWTDTKIRAYAFCCVMSMTLMRVMQWTAQKTGFKMGPELLKEELADIQEVIMVYSHNNATRKITDRSAVQEKLWNAFKLHEIERQVVTTLMR
jgi:transposase